MKIALIGCGTHAEQQHAAPFAHLARTHPGRIELVACCDLDTTRAARLAAQYGFRRAYINIDRMLEEAMRDAVVSVLPVAREP